MHPCMITLAQLTLDNIIQHTKGLVSET